MPEENSGRFTKGSEIEALLDRLAAERVPPDARMQCKVCWYIYDPAEGCPETQTPPGTPFSELPEWWSCPHCDTPAALFLPVPEDETDSAADTSSEATDGNQTR